MTDEMLDRLALEVPCPICRAPKGTACGHVARRPREHEHREHAAKPAGRPDLKTKHGWTCESAHEGKKRYPSRAKAERALQRIRKLGDKHPLGKPIRAYSCGVCGGFFITHLPR